MTFPPVQVIRRLTPRSAELKVCEYLSLRVDSSVLLQFAALVYGDLKSGPVKLFGVFFEAAFPAKRAYPALERGKVFLRLDHRLVSFYGDFALFYGDQSG